MNENDVMVALWPHLVAGEHDPTTLYLPEFQLGWGEARVDLAVVNGVLAGFEIKSAVDRLDRLPRQVDIYSKSLEQVTLVAASRHLERALTIVPDWWGVIEAVGGHDGVDLVVHRDPGANPGGEPVELAFLLRRDEINGELRRLGHSGISRLARHELVALLVDELDLDALWALVRARLKLRRGDLAGGSRPST